LAALVADQPSGSEAVDVVLIASVALGELPREAPGSFEVTGYMLVLRQRVDLQQRCCLSGRYSQKMASLTEVAIESVAVQVIA
jgi:hypothetical protein